MALIHAPAQPVCAHCRAACPVQPVRITFVGVRLLCQPCRRALDAMGYGLTNAGQATGPVPNVAG